MPTFPTNPEAIERFWAKVDKSEACWRWTASLTRGGYGQYAVRGHGTWRAHRFAYWDAIGPIPDGLGLHHRCGDPLCVRPDHLEPMEDTVNIRLGNGIAMRHKRKGRCVNGHDFTPENTRLYRGSRVCRACRRAAQQARRANRS